jgi:hypothetical protein
MQIFKLVDKPNLIVENEAFLNRTQTNKLTKLADEVSACLVSMHVSLLAASYSQLFRKPQGSTN